MRLDSDILIIGSGFSGCITASVLSKLGYRVCVVDKLEHPRFAIGESSTPLADRTLQRIAQCHELDWLMPLTAYGAAQAIAGEVTVGLKRGFSYFQHEHGKPFQPFADHSTELLVAASTDDAISDTHWLRSTVDHYIARQFLSSNPTNRLIENFEIERIKQTDRWEMIGTRREGAAAETWLLTSRFVIDASGGAMLFGDATGQRDISDRLKTNTGAVFGHFRGLQNWNDLFEQLGGDAHAHPYRSDQAAVHHLIDEGWLWQLGFDNGITSCGIVINHLNQAQDIGLAEAAGAIWDADAIWRVVLGKYPSLSRQFAEAELVAPECLVGKQRLQYLRTPASGTNWLSLPSAIGFVDPLHSTGIAHTLSAVERIGELFAKCDSPSQLPSHESLLAYGNQLRCDILWIDQLVSMCYCASFDFSLFTAATMTYFVAVTNAELDERDGFLASGHAPIRARVEAISHRISEFRDERLTKGVSDEKIAATVRWIRDQMKPFNHVGLMDTAKSNLYLHTAPAKSGYCVR